jgi:hypothetical protein
LTSVHPLDAAHGAEDSLRNPTAASLLAPPFPAVLRSISHRR